MNSPQNPSPRQYAELEKAGQLSTFGETEKVQINNAAANARLTLPRQEVSLLVFEW